MPHFVSQIKILGNEKEPQSDKTENEDLRRPTHIKNLLLFLQQGLPTKFCEKFINVRDTETNFSIHCVPGRTSIKFYKITEFDKKILVLSAKVCYN